MTRPYRILSAVDKAVAEPPSAVAVESDFIVILAALLCGLICVLGLIAVARCAWLRRGSVDSGSRTSESANKGMKKKVIEVIPKFTYSLDTDGKGCGNLCSSDCAICLAEYAGGDEIRVLPQCGHGFHVQCIDTWLSSHSSCPSCRQVLVAPRCKTCGELPAVSSGNAPSVAEGKGGEHSSSTNSSSSSSSSSGYLS